MKKIYFLISLLMILSSAKVSNAALSILLVNDNGADASRVDVIKTAITNSGYTYTFYNTIDEGVSPTASLMSEYNLVIWYTGNDYSGLYFWNANETDNQEIIDYIDGGGMLWVQGLDFLYDRYSSAPDDFSAGDFVYDYLGISEYHAQAHYDDGSDPDGVPQLDVVADNGIFTLNPLLWSYTTMWGVDALMPTSAAQGLYTMGPTGYDFDSYYSVIYNNKNESKIISSAFETARFDTQDNCDAYVGEGLAFFEEGVVVDKDKVSVLLVNDNNNGTDRVDVIKDAITNSGYTYTFFNTIDEGASPTAALMSNYDIVIWYTGNDYSSLYFWNGSETDNQEIKDYVDGGGMLWLQGLDFLYDKYPSVPTTFTTGDFVYDYLGISEYHAQAHYDDGFYSDGVPQLDVVADNGIFTLNPLLWSYTTMWGVDALMPTDAAEGLYTMGPTDYDFDDYYSVIYNEKGDGKVLSSAFETARFDSQDNCDAFMLEGLDYYRQFASGDVSIAVASVSVSGAGDATTITTDGASLQMNATVLPENATNKAVFWTVTDGTATATIDANGLLQSTGTVLGNGTVVVTATSADNSSIIGTLEVTISGQGTGEGFSVLLVNDNANGTDRYEVLNTTLINLEVNYDLYDTYVTKESPSLTLLNDYDLVIWYTGNDGVDLNLWDTTDKADYKFNEELLTYINNKGNVWVQGLDFMYDVFGGAPDDFTPGQFIYDYMGISKYAAQSRADDGEEGVSGTGVAQLDVVAGNGVSIFTPILWAYSTLYFVDGFEITDAAQGMYKMGPAGYVLDAYYSALYTQQADKGIVMTWATETARIDTQNNTDAIFEEVLAFFEANTPISTGFENINTDFAQVEAVFPNPARENSELVFTLTKSANVHFNLIDMTGRSVCIEDYGNLNKGKHNIQINKAKLNIREGIYMYSLTIDNQRFTGKVIFK